MRKTSVKVGTTKCGMCEDAHSGYTIKLDSKKIPYVVCGIYHKRMNIMLDDVRYDAVSTVHDFMYGTLWTIESGTEEDIKKVKFLLAKRFD